MNKNVFCMEQKVFLCLLWRFSRFACMVFAREESRESTVDYFDSSLGNCGLKVGNSFLYFSLSLGYF